MQGLKGERMLMRIYVEEKDKYHGKSVYEAVMELLHDRHFAGATAFQGRLGFGANSTIHTERVLTFMADLPVVVECIDSEERIRAIIPEIDDMMDDGLITLEQVRVILYRKNPSDQERTEDEKIDVTGSWQVVKPPT